MSIAQKCYFLKSFLLLCLVYLIITKCYAVFKVLTVQLSTNGGDEEDRTPDPLRARQVLSQLSYTPMLCFQHIIL